MLANQCCKSQNKQRIDINKKIARSQDFVYSEDKDIVCVTDT